MRHSPDTVHTRVPTPLGEVVIAASPRGITGLWFDGQRHQPDASGWTRDDAHPLLRRAAAALQASLAAGTGAAAGRASGRDDLPLDLSGGTPFQQAVWQALLGIPRGGTTSYGALAQRIGRPQAVRAVGAAVGRNPVSVLVPCHRVLGADGSLTGYAGGLERKRALLRAEGVLA